MGVTNFTLDANPVEMRRHADQLRQHTAEYRRCTQNVLNEARSLSTTWEGEAKEEFMRILDQDAPEFDILYAELNQFCDAVTESANVYERTQNEISAEMRSTGRR